jgi:2,4-dienoyl-CoA reductase (NADPH2)
MWSIVLISQPPSVEIASGLPGKEEFYETLRYYQRQLELLGVDVKLNQQVSIEDLNASDFDEIILATGILPRIPDIEGIDHPSVLSYIDVISGKVEVGNRVAIIGAGGIGFDVAEYLSHAGPSSALDIPAFMNEWGIDMEMHSRGGIEGIEANVTPSPRTIHLLQRKSEGLGKNLGKTTGWIHRLGLIKRGIKMPHQGLRTALKKCWDMRWIIWDTILPSRAKPIGKYPWMVTANPS